MELLDFTYGWLKTFLPYYILISMLIELIVLRIYGKSLNRIEYRINIITGIIIVATQSSFQYLLLSKLNPLIYNYRLFDLRNITFSIFICVFVYTLLQYFTHLLSHKVRLFWCLHEVHHSSNEITISSGLRNSIFDIISTDVFYLLIPLIGIHPMIYFIVYSFAKIWGTFIHINENIVYEIPILNRILMDPKSHHLHHARNAIYIDKNFCETFILYDVLFKTYAKQTENPIYGSFNNPIPKGFWDVHLNEFRLLKKDIKESKSLLEAIKFIFYPPGWKP